MEAVESGLREAGAASVLELGLALKSNRWDPCRDRLRDSHHLKIKAPKLSCFAVTHPIRPQALHRIGVHGYRAKSCNKLLLCLPELFGFYGAAVVIL